MGLYLNPGMEALKKDINSDVYVDKSEIIDFINGRIDKSNRYICVSRPRRFGKTMAANMLSAYYDKSCDSDVIFNKLKISKRKSYKKHLNKYDVIFVNVQKFIGLSSSVENITECMCQRIIKELKKNYSEIDADNTSLFEMMELIYTDKDNDNDGFVIIIDEWDCLFRIAKDNDAAQRKYLDFLRDLIKDRTYVKLAYMTGILPIKKYGTHSALNVFDEFSMTSAGQLARYIGFTETEVRSLCSKYKVSFTETKRWYDGYSFSNIKYIYNPKSIVDVLNRKKFKSYWTSTETYEALQEYIDLDFDGLRSSILDLLAGSRVTVDVESFKNDMHSFANYQDILTLFVHLGYLAYDENRQEVYIPNEEIRQEFKRAVSKSNNTEMIGQIQLSKKLLESTMQLDTNAVSGIIEQIHNQFTASIFYNNEQALRTTILIAYYSCIDEYNMFQELPSGKGIADIVYIPKKGIDKPALLIELKYDESAKGAIEQIYNKNYPSIVKKFTGNILLVGINYDKSSRKHTCLIEKY